MSRFPWENWQPDPRQPEAIRIIALAVRDKVFRTVGPPPFGPDGFPQVVHAFEVAGGADLYFRSLTETLADLLDPAVAASVRRQADHCAGSPSACVLLVVAREGDWWCVAVREIQGGRAAADA